MESDCPVITDATPSGIRHSPFAIRHYAGAFLACYALFSSFIFYVNFVQYALLRRAAAALGLGERDLAPGFALLALGGIAGSLLAGRLIDRRKLAQRAIARAAGLLSLAAAGAAAGAMLAPSRGTLIVAFAPLGLALGLLIVSLLTLFSLAVPADRRGLAAGATAGAIYSIASLLGWAARRPEAVAAFDMALIGSNIIIVLLPGAFARTAPPLGRPGAIGAMLRRLLPLAAVVFADTALFVLVSRAPGETAILASARDWRWFGAAHLLGAVGAGLLYGRLGWRRLNRAAACGLGALALLYLLHRFAAGVFGLPILLVYGATVGVYTTALFAVFGDETSSDNPAYGIAWGMVLVGWVASPAGIALGTALVG
jgi:hypothetical protein